MGDDTNRISPLVIPPSQYWNGLDGPWSTFWMSIGSPPQTVRLLPSTTGNAIWPVMPEGCPPTSSSDCASSRGGIFNPANSSSWSSLGIFSLGLTNEKFLGYKANGSFGYDDLHLGPPTEVSSTTTNDVSPVLRHQLVQGFINKDFPLGSIGLSANSMNVGSFTNTTASFLAALKEQASIPSLSWGYTAGASYTSPPAFGSLTLGGYDESRFERNNVTFPFGEDKNRELLVHIDSITSTAFATRNIGTYALLDSLVPDLWLPPNVCSDFEKAFGLRYNASTNRYLIAGSNNSDLYRDTTTSFLLNTGPGSPSVDITLPFSSFLPSTSSTDNVSDQPSSPNKGKNDTIRYFPLRQAHNATQYTIGRTFFQNAYVIADFERSAFQVHQAKFPSGTVTKPSLVAIQPPTTPATNLKDRNASSLSKAAIAGITAALSLLLLLTLLMVRLYRRRRRKRHLTNDSSSSSTNEFRKPELDNSVDVAKIELSQDAAMPKPELPPDVIAQLDDPNSKEWCGRGGRVEMLGDTEWREGRNENEERGELRGEWEGFEVMGERVVGRMLEANTSGVTVGEGEGWEEGGGREGEMDEGEENNALKTNERIDNGKIRERERGIVNSAKSASLTSPQDIVSPLSPEEQRRPYRKI